MNCTSSAGDAGLIPGQGTRIPHAGRPKQTNKQNSNYAGPNGWSCPLVALQRRQCPSPHQGCFGLGPGLLFQVSALPAAHFPAQMPAPFCGPSLILCEDGSDVSCMLSISWEGEGGARWRSGITPYDTHTIPPKCLLLLLLKSNTNGTILENALSKISLVTQAELNLVCFARQARLTWPESLHASASGKLKSETSILLWKW